MGTIKNHFKKHKTLYVGAACLAVGVAGGILYVHTKGINPAITQKAVALWNSTINQTAVQITIDAPGNSGNIIKDLTTGAIYPSQNAAAKAIGVSPGNLSKHLNGKQDFVSGHVFEKIVDGKATHVLKTA